MSVNDKETYIYEVFSNGVNHRRTARFIGGLGDISPQRGCKMLAFCVPRYEIPRRTSKDKME